MKCSRRSSRAFTLIELLVVIAIMSILAGLSLAGIGKVIQRSRIARTRATLNSLQLAFHQYFTSLSQYPWPIGSPPTGEPIRNVLRELAPSRYDLAGTVPSFNTTADFFTIPRKLEGNSAAGTLLLDPWGIEYNIKFDAANQQTIIWSNGPDGVDETSDGDTNYGDDLHRIF